MLLKKAAVGIATTGIIAAGLILGTAGTASAGPYYESGCAALRVERGYDNTYTVFAGASSFFGCGMYGHFEMWGPGYYFNGPDTPAPSAFYRGSGYGDACARMWQDNGGGNYTERGTVCGDL